MRFRGVLTALVTPMNRDGSVDEGALRQLVEAQIAGGVHGLVPVGTTGESATLSHPEHMRVVEVVAKAVAGRVPVLAGAGSNSTREAIELAHACKAAGVDGCLQVVPYYNKPDQDGLVAHFSAIADAVELPVVLYNVPGRTSCDLLPETVARLASHERIVGIKEATGDMRRASRIRELVGSEFALLSGDDFTMLPLFAVGGHGVISVVSNPAPRLIADLYEHFQAGRLDQARELHDRQLPLSRLLFTAPNPVPAKAAVHLLGIGGPTVRSPLQPLDLDGALANELRSVMRELGLLA